MVTPRVPTTPLHVRLIKEVLHLFRCSTHTHIFVTHTQLCHTPISHTSWLQPSFTHIFVTTIFHTHLCHTPSFIHNVVTRHLPHTSLLHAIFHTHLGYTPSRKTKPDVANCHACHVKRRQMSPSATLCVCDTVSCDKFVCEKVACV